MRLLTKCLWLRNQVEALVRLTSANRSEMVQGKETLLHMKSDKSKSATCHDFH